MLVMPAIKQSISSGNNGNKNAIIKKNFPRLLIRSAYFFAFCSPAIQITNLLPNTLPIKNEPYEPINTPNAHSVAPKNGP